MPNLKNTGQVYSATGYPETDTFASGYRPGEIGQTRRDYNNRLWQRVLLDATTSLAPLAGMQVFAKDRTTFTVTCKLADSDADRNGAVGCIPIISGQVVPTTTLKDFWMLVEGNQVSLTAANATYTKGEDVFPNSGTAADLTRVALGTAPGYNAVGTVHTTVTGTTVVCDVKYPGIQT